MPRTLSRGGGAGEARSQAAHALQSRRQRRIASDSSDGEALTRSRDHERGGCLSGAEQPKLSGHKLDDTRAELFTANPIQRRRNKQAFATNDEQLARASKRFMLAYSRALAAADFELFWEDQVNPRCLDVPLLHSHMPRHTSLMPPAFGLSLVSPYRTVQTVLQPARTAVHTHDLQPERSHRSVFTLSFSIFSRTQAREPHGAL